MPTSLTLQDSRFFINGQPTYVGRTWFGHSVEGLLFNSRMIQAIFDDECPETREVWAYPDTGKWDPDRNTDEFCAALTNYRRHGLLAFTLGLQGGGSVYTPGIYDRYRNSAFDADGEIKPAYWNRLARVLRAADEAGMVAIVSAFYWVEGCKIADRALTEHILIRTAERLLETGHRNLIFELANEVGAHWKNPFTIAETAGLIRKVQSVERDGRRLLVGCSLFPKVGDIPPEDWLEAEDVTLPHGNDHTAGQLREKIRAIKATAAYRKRPRPIVVNEDGIFIDNLDAALAEGASWGLYHQGWGSGNKDQRMDWRTWPRESDYAKLSGFQTLPVNWSINDPWKKAFFDRVREITGGL
ncbi:MAG: hypothetical protein EA425_05315 [Puniceicoccaceae bacterium]|nr:MAG: hypothetical protein EA425_05315 [Puniceicoccaceae bacterium]